MVVYLLLKQEILGGGTFKTWILYRTAHFYLTCNHINLALPQSFQSNALQKQVLLLTQRFSTAGPQPISGPQHVSQVGHRT